VRVALDLAQGVAFIHSGQVVHRDLAARNILVDADGRLKLADFGLARSLVQEGETYRYQMRSKEVRPYYVYPPECQSLGDDFDACAEVWCFGLALWEIVSGLDPFEEGGGEAGSWRPSGLDTGEPRLNKLLDVSACVRAMRFSFFCPPCFTPLIDLRAWQDIVAGCVLKDRERRLTMARICTLLKSHAEEVCIFSEPGLCSCNRPHFDCICDLIFICTALMVPKVAQSAHAKMLD
jgi:serine/threonine protein kinase